MGQTIPLPMDLPEVDVLGDIEEIDAPVVDIGEDLPEVDIGEDLPIETTDNAPEVDIGEDLPQVIADESEPEYPFVSIEEQESISLNEISALSRAAEKAGNFFMKALELDSVAYKASAAAEMAYRQGFTPMEVAQIAWDAATDLERLHQPEMQDIVFLNAIQSGSAPQEAREQSNSAELIGQQMVGETVMAPSNLVPHFRGIKRYAKPIKEGIKYAARLPATITKNLPKHLLDSAFGLPKDMFEELVKRGPEVEAQAKFFRSPDPKQTPFDEYARRLASVFDDMEENHIYALEQANDTLETGVSAYTLTNALDFSIESAHFLNDKSDVAVKYNKLMKGIKDKVRADIAGISNIDIAQGKLKPENVFLINRVVKPETVKTILRSIDDTIEWSTARGMSQTEETKFLWNTRRQIDDVLKDMPGNEEYAKRMGENYETRTRLDAVAKNFGIFNKGDAALKINGKSLKSHGNSLSSPNNAKGLRDKKIEIALENMNILLGRNKELGKDLMTSEQVLKDLSLSENLNDATKYQKQLIEALKTATPAQVMKDLSLSEALKNATINGSRRVAAFSVITGGIGAGLGINPMMMSVVGGAVGFINDTHGREIGEAVVRNFVSEQSKFRRIIINNVNSVHNAAQGVFSDALETVLPGMTTALIRKMIDGDEEAYDYDTNIFKVDNWELIQRAITEVKASDKIPTVKKMNQITDWIHEFRKTGAVSFQASPLDENGKNNPKLENLKKFNKTESPPSGGWTHDTEARGIRVRKGESPPSETVSPDEEARGTRKRKTSSPPSETVWPDEEARGTKRRKK